MVPVCFFKAPRSLGSHVRFLDAYVDQTQCRRDYPNNFETRHTEYAHHHTRTQSAQVRTVAQPSPVGSHQRELPLGQRPIRYPYDY